MTREPLPLRGFRQRRCDGCRLPPELCVCGQLPLIDNQFRVHIVVHFREWNKSTNTARIAARMLRSCRVLIRGGPSPTLGRDVDRELALIPPASALLLYPRDDATALDQVPPSPLIDTLIVPDGTWSQTRRLVRRHAAFQHVQAVHLGAPTTEYRLRRGVHPGTCCTLEAIAAALGVLESPALTLQMMQALQLWQHRTLQVRGLLSRVTPAAI